MIICVLKRILHKKTSISIQLLESVIPPPAGLHNLFHPTIRDGSTWSKSGARGFSENRAPALELNKDIHGMFV